ncbi:MAG: hypothetical protein R2800_03825 [Flavipsychrobacter sp.]
MRIIIPLAILLFLTNISEAQDYTWWNTKHNWDGKTPWQNYMTLSAKYTGPNALPVPEITTGKLPKSSFLEVGIAGHISGGDQTVNGVLNTIIKAGKKAALGIYFVPYEVYNMDTNTSRNIRNTRDYDGQGNSVGDVYISGYYQILTHQKYRPDILLTFGVKTASGNNLEAARFTDAPGYYFNLSIGRTIPFKALNFTSIRHYIMAGMYVWQTYSSQYKQDDAVLYGAGIELTHPHFIIEEQVGGYFGYINNGDRPVVSRLSIRSNRDKLINYKLLYQQGFVDAPYTTLVISTTINLDRIKQSLIKDKEFNSTTTAP